MRIMSELMADLLGNFVCLYLDNILILSHTKQEQLRHIAAVYNKLKGTQYYASRKKSEFFPARIEGLGHIIDDEGQKPHPGNVAKIDA